MLFNTTRIPDDSRCMSSSYNNELTGLGAIFSDSDTLYGVDRGVHKWMKPYIKAVDGDTNGDNYAASHRQTGRVNGSRWTL